MGVLGKNRRPRWTPSDEAKALLEVVFCGESFPTLTVRNQLAGQLGIDPRQVQIWFQNRRQRERVKGSASKGDGEEEDDDKVLVSETGLLYPSDPAQPSGHSEDHVLSGLAGGTLSEHDRADAESSAACKCAKSSAAPGEPSEEPHAATALAALAGALTSTGAVGRCQYEQEASREGG